MIHLAAAAAVPPPPPDASAPLAVGLLATDGTIQGGLYHAALATAATAAGWPAVRVLTVGDQDATHAVIATVKAGTAGAGEAATLRAQAQELVDAGAAVVITGCTELPLLLHADSAPDFPVPLVDPVTVLAAAVVAHTAGSAASAPTKQ